MWMITGRECCGWTEEVGKYESAAFFSVRGGAEHFCLGGQAEAATQYYKTQIPLRSFWKPSVRKTDSHQHKAQQCQMLA